MPSKKYEEIEVSTYDWKISLKKFFTGLIITIVPVTLLYAIGFLETEEFPPEYAAFIPLIVGILHFIMNATKHWGDTEIYKVDKKTGEIID